MTINEEAGNTEAACVHHWEIGNPNGRTSVGVCRECGAEREFSTSASAAGWSRAPQVDAE